MAEMTNAQVAVMAAATAVSGRDGHMSGSTVVYIAREIYQFLEEKS